MSSSPASESDDAIPPGSAGNSASPEVLLLNRQRAVRVNGAKLRQGFRALSSRLARSSFSVCLLSDGAIRRYNQQFRGRNQATDVLSFPRGDRGTKRPDYLGDILISVETARRNARRYGLRLEEEITVLVLHGVLHLLGYDHERDHGHMARLEARWGKKLGLPQNLTSRAWEAPGGRPRRIS